MKSEDGLIHAALAWSHPVRTICGNGTFDHDAVDTGIPFITCEECLVICADDKREMIKEEQEILDRLDARVLALRELNRRRADG